MTDTTSLREPLIAFLADHENGKLHSDQFVQAVRATLAALAEPQAWGWVSVERGRETHTPTVTVRFGIGDWDARDRFAAALLAAAPSPASRARPEAQGEEIVGHKTLRDESGRTYHEPLKRAEADQLIRNIEEQESRRNGLMPDERAAIAMFFDAWVRLKDFGWREAIYCPKDGSMFKVIEPGSTGIFDCTYEGEWPNGGWWIHADCDSSPSHPAMFKPKDAP